MDAGLPITADDIVRYQRDGAVLIKGVLNAETQRLLEVGIEECYRSQSKRLTKLNSAMGDGETVVRDYASQDSPSLRALIDNGVVGQIGAALMQTSSAHLILDQIFHKAKGPIIPTPWHQDTPFLRVRGDELIRLWFPCDSSPRALTVQVVRGSHRWNVVYNTSDTKPTDAAVTASGSADRTGVGDSWYPPAPDVRRYRDSFDILSWDVEPGDVVAFQGNMLHGSDGHAGHDRPRRAFAVLLGGPQLHYYAPRGKAFPSPGRVRGLRTDDNIPSGDPIGNHEDAFPLCWRAPAAHASTISPA